MGPFHFDAWMISLVRWKPVVEVNYPYTIIFRVYVLDIPLHFWAAQTFRSVGDALGKVQGEVDITEGRVRVEVDGFKPLIFSMTINFDEGVELPVSLRYEKLVGFCSSSLQGRQSGYHGPREQERRPATQSRGIQHLRGGEEGLPLIPEKLMLDAFKVVEISPKASGGSKVNEVLDTASKTRKFLMQNAKLILCLQS
ncbi:Uncharacterized protein Rs2_04896 [Raphanus sativus]|nr:Uncharacterized protein Rs2_04896 [Raphanus sativus]